MKNSAVNDLEEIMLRRLEDLDRNGTYAEIVRLQRELDRSESRVASFREFAFRSKVFQSPQSRIWVSPAHAYPSIADELRTDYGRAVFVSHGGRLLGYVGLSRSIPSRISELDIYADGRLIGEVPLARPLRSNLSVELDWPVHSGDSCLIEMTAGTRLICAQHVSRVAHDHVPDYAGGLQRIEESAIIGWIVDRNDRSQSLPVIVNVDGRESMVAAHERARFSKAPIKRFVVDLAAVGCEHGKIHHVQLLNGHSRKKLDRGEFALCRKDGALFIWRLGSFPSLDVFGTVLCSANVDEPIEVDLIVGDTRRAEAKADLPDLGSFRLQGGLNSFRFAAGEVASETHRARLRFRSGPLSVDSESFDMTSLNPISVKN